MRTRAQVARIETATATRSSSTARPMTKRAVSETKKRLPYDEIPAQSG